MNWCTIDNEFMNYLRAFEPRVPNTNYGDKFKPFFRPLFTIGDLLYCGNVSHHPRPRHLKMKNSKDFYKLYNGKKLIGVVNLNYMFPVPTSLIIDVTGNNIEKFRKFKDEEDKSSYLFLLRKEMQAIKKYGLDSKAERLYRFTQDFPDHFISKRCFKFKELELHAKKYKVN